MVCMKRLKIASPLAPICTCLPSALVWMEEGLTILAASSQAFAGATLDRIEQKKELVGVLMESYAPFSFLNDQNQLDGFDVDVAKAGAENLPR